MKDCPVHYEKTGVLRKKRAHNKKRVPVTSKVSRNPKQEPLLKTVMRKHSQSRPCLLSPNHDKTPADIFI